MHYQFEQSQPYLKYRKIVIAITLALRDACADSEVSLNLNLAIYLTNLQSIFFSDGSPSVINVFMQLSILLAAKRIILQ